MNRLFSGALLSTLSLFASVGTLLCCALPALLVTLGLGAALSGVISAAPWVTAVSEYKLYVFLGAGVMLGVAAFMHWRARHMPCPVDPMKALACARLRNMNRWVLLCATVIYIVGFFFAFMAADWFYG